MKLVDDDKKLKIMNRLLDYKRYKYLLECESYDDERYMEIQNIKKLYEKKNSIQCHILVNGSLQNFYRTIFETIKEQKLIKDGLNKKINNNINDIMKFEFINYLNNLISEIMNLERRNNPSREDLKRKIGLYKRLEELSLDSELIEMIVKSITLDEKIKSEKIILSEIESLMDEEEEIIRRNNEREKLKKKEKNIQKILKHL